MAAFGNDSRPADPRGPVLADWQGVLIVLAGSAAALIGLLWWRLGRA